MIANITTDDKWWLYQWLIENEWIPITEAKVGTLRPNCKGGGLSLFSVDGFVVDKGVFISFVEEDEVKTEGDDDESGDEVVVAVDDDDLLSLCKEVDEFVESLLFEPRRVNLNLLIAGLLRERAPADCLRGFSVSVTRERRGSDFLLLFSF